VLNVQMLYCPPMFARELIAEMTVAGERRPVPLDWLDSFCMRNFTGSAEFEDTLPTADGRLEAGLRVDPQRLAASLSEWLTKRGKGNGHPIVVEIRELPNELRPKAPAAIQSELPAEVPAKVPANVPAEARAKGPAEGLDRPETNQS
jgi:hypothetical protein